MRQEIGKLRVLLKEHNIEHENFIDQTPKYSFIHKKDLDTRNQILIKCKDEPELKISCISHYGSYGASDGLIEIYDFINEPIGFLTADEAFKFIERKMKEWEREASAPEEEEK